MLSFSKALENMSNLDLDLPLGANISGGRFGLRKRQPIVNSWWVKLC